MPSRLLLLFALAALAPCASSQQPTLAIQLDKPVHAVSPTLYGLMTEEINYSYDGGLYAELVRNRTFQDHGFGGVAHWSVEQAGESTASMDIDSTTGPSASLDHSLRLTVNNADALHPAGVRNEGYWGIPLHAGTTYKGSLYAKAEADDTLTVSLVNDNSGDTLASSTIPGVSTAWKRFDFTLTTAKSPPRLRITSSSPPRTTASCGWT